MAVIFASRMGLIAFAATALEAAVSGMDLAGGMTQSLINLALFYGLGWIAGGIAGRLSEEHAEREFENWKLAAEKAVVPAK